MDIEEVISFAKTQRGQGWLGAMNIIDLLNAEKTSIPVAKLTELRRNMEICLGKIMLSGELGGDEHATKAACDQCIESVATYYQDDSVPQ